MLVNQFLVDGHGIAAQAQWGCLGKGPLAFAALRTAHQMLEVPMLTSGDNAFVESLFRTAKCRPEFPSTGFADLNAAREWAHRFVHWYNHEHRHSGIRYVSPAQRHAGHDAAILGARHELYLRARERNPARWSRATRNWTPLGAVTLNPEREAIVDAHSGGNRKQRIAA